MRTASSLSAGETNFRNVDIVSANQTLGPEPDNRQWAAQTLDNATPGFWGGLRRIGAGGADPTSIGQQPPHTLRPVGDALLIHRVPADDEADRRQRDIEGGPVHVGQPVLG